MYPGIGVFTFSRVENMRRIKLSGEEVCAGLSIPFFFVMLNRGCLLNYFYNTQSESYSSYYLSCGEMPFMEGSLWVEER